MKKLIYFWFLFNLIGCNSLIDSRADARISADFAMKNYCSHAGDVSCEALHFSQIYKSGEKWLVEYESKLYSYVLIVDTNGAVDITRESKGESPPVYRTPKNGDNPQERCLWKIVVSLVLSLNKKLYVH